MAQAYFNALVGNLLPTGRQINFTLIQEEYMHEVATIELQDAAFSPTLYRTGVPVKVDYGYAPTALNTFYGYINNTTQEIKSNKRNITITAVGASYPLNKKVVRVWGNVSGSYIAKTIALENKLTPYVQTSPYVFPNYTQTDSMFGALTWLAKRLGYTTYVQGTGLFFYDPASPILANGFQIPAFNFPKSRGLFGSLIEFHPSVGETNSGPAALAQRMQRQVTGIDLFQQSLVGMKSAVALDVAFNKNYQNTPQLNELINNRPVGTVADAKQALLAADQVNRFWVTATATVWGDPRVHAGAYAAIEGVDPTHAGLWYVQRAAHHVTYTPKAYVKYQYQIDMNLGRDQVDQTTFMIPPQWTNAKKQPPTVFQNGGWRSSFAVDNSLVQSA